MRVAGWVAAGALLAALGVAGASAQPAASNAASALRFQNFHMGMSIAEARATAPGSWTQDGDAHDAALTGGPQLSVGGRSYSPVLQFGETGLNGIIYASGFTTPSPQECSDAAVAAAAGFEVSTGALNGAPAPWELGTPSNTAHAGSASSLRFYPPDQDNFTNGYANKRGALFVELRSRFGANVDQNGDVGASHCVITVAMEADPMPALAGHWQADAPSAADLAHAQPLANPQWAAQPSADDFARFFPTIADSHHIEGRAVVDCLVQADGTLKCAVSSETPTNLGFGQAAVDIMHLYRVAPPGDGSSVTGRLVHKAISFRSS